MAFFKAVFPPDTPETVTYTYRPYTERGETAFMEAMASQSWESVLSAPSADAKAAAFQKIIDDNMNVFFPLKTTTRRKSDPPWVNDLIRRLSVKRRKIYDREGRSTRWKRLKKKVAELYRTRAQQYIQKQKDLLTGPDASRFFYKRVKAYRSREKPPDFNVCDLFPNKSKKEVAEDLADHFNSISKEFSGIPEGKIPEAPSEPPPIVSREQVEAQLCSFKKTGSMVEGDIFPRLVDRVAPWISAPLTDLYNCITSTQDWPSLWKVEYVTAIPKKSRPADVNDLRNISCTKFFSKVYEKFVLTWLGDSSSLRHNQYGGVKGCGTEHFLVQLWQDILEGLDDSRAGMFLTSIDYSKAFNRLDFVRCLEALKAKGFGHELINLIASFLTGRQMTVKVGQERSEPRTIEGGVPQGSRLGVFLFNVTIDNFEAFSDDVEPYGPRPAETLSPQELLNIPPDIPVPAQPYVRDHKHLPPFKHVPILVQKYVDDNILLERINFDLLQTDGFGQRNYLSLRIQNLFRHIVARAETCGMRVNASKTTAMLVSELKSYTPDVHFSDNNGNTINTSQNMKILGFNMSSSPDMQAQVDSIKRKFRTRMWILRHLAHRGLLAQDLLKVYQSIILPCHDYCSVVYHSSLTAFQANSLERLQSQALKCIFGYQYSYRALLEMSGLPTLEARREARCTRFASKTVANPRFAHWFPRAEQPRTLRNRAVFQESRAKTNRLFKSPLYDLRRRLNAA